ncbi:MAG: polysaccharide deacetylase family protein [bacterium]|nr:polysaccharide deacetylase family protein [bacterium]
MRAVLALTISFVAVWLTACSSKPDAPSASARSNTTYVEIFHDVSPDKLNGLSISPDYLRDVLRMIELGGRKTIFASLLAEWIKQGVIPDNDSIVLCFDDGEPGALDYAEPILREFGMQATAFVFTSGIDDGRPRHMGWDDLLQLVARGAWEVHSHSHTHPILYQQSDDAIREELITSLDRLQRHDLALYAPLFAYPSGTNDPRVQQAVRDAGYFAAFKAGPIPSATSGADLFAIPRNTITQFYDQDLICRKLGVDLKEIRKKLIILEESEGSFDGGWSQIQCTPDAPRGQHGKGYAASKAGNAKWQVEIEIQEAGFYAIGIWLPPIGMKDAPFELRIQQEGLDGSFKNESLPGVRNGWNRLGGLDLNAGKLTLSIQSLGEQPLILDAVRLMRTEEPRPRRRLLNNHNPALRRTTRIVSSCRAATFSIAAARYLAAPSGSRYAFITRSAICEPSV